ncbi:type 1 fimbrial protein [Serratia nematodiphila]|nr:type 1 fimbrial protein [Serratia nematodiphila]
MEGRIKNVKALCLLLWLMGFAEQAISATQGQGRVNMQGAIIDTACAIATESREQIIDAKIMPIADIEREGKGKSVPFRIELINCVLERQNTALPDWQYFQVTFDGNADGEMFGIGGDASGISLVISDEAGNIALPGVPLPVVAIQPGSMTLNYRLTLTANQQPLKAGSYFSSVRFKMDYY